MLWENTTGDLKRGYRFEAATGHYHCLFCASSFDGDEVTRHGDRWMTAEGTVKEHLREVHGSVLSAIVTEHGQAMGLSEVQREVLIRTSLGESDKTIAAQMGGKAESTIRNQRYQLRERYKEAKLLVAAMELVLEGHRADPLMEFGTQLKIRDDRAAVTERERSDILGQYLETPDGELPRLKHFPRKEKRKLVILAELTKRFEHGRKYSEAEVNDLLAAAHHDHVTLRRYLIEYGFLDRTRDCSEYWRTAG